MPRATTKAKPVVKRETLQDDIVPFVVPDDPQDTLIHAELFASFIKQDVHKVRNAIAASSQARRCSTRGMVFLRDGIAVMYEHARDDSVTTTAAAGEIGVSLPVLLALCEKGYIKKRPDGRVSLREAFRGRIKFIEEQRSLNAQPAKQGKARLEAARAREVELRVAETEGKLVPIDDVLARVDAAFGGLRTDLSSLPARVTRDLELRRTIEAAINDMLEAHADRIAKEAEEAQAEEEDGDRKDDKAEVARDPEADRAVAEAEPSSAS